MRAWGGMGEVEMRGSIGREFSMSCSGVERHWWVQRVG